MGGQHRKVFQVPVDLLVWMCCLGLERKKSTALQLTSSRMLFDVPHVASDADRSPKSYFCSQLVALVWASWSFWLVVQLPPRSCLGNSNSCRSIASLPGKQKKHQMQPVDESYAESRHLGKQALRLNVLVSPRVGQWAASPSCTSRG